MAKDDLNLGGVFEAALEIGKRQQYVMSELRNELENHNDVAALRLAKILTGLESTDTEPT